MIKIEKAKKEHYEVLALLGRITYTESHGEYIDNKDDLSDYNNKAFSISKVKAELNDPNNIFYITYVNDLPVGYAKLVLNDKNENIPSEKNCRLERIYILADFIPMKIGQQFLDFLFEKSKELKLDTMWLSVYIHNVRAIKFYQRNDFKKVGGLSFIVGDKKYDNFVMSKRL